jgi:His/Glu/Gln/Arg/opine family amino acid ABC transporter permease subunit
MIGTGHFVSYFLLLLKGVLVTLELSLGALILGTAGGLVLGLLRTARLRVVRALPLAYIEIVRSTPFLILLFFIYYGLPLALNTDIPAYPAAVAALSVHCAAYMAEVVRAGLQSVPSGQTEAAAALGLRYRHIMRLVIIPQALRVMVPPTIGVYISTIKESSLASVIGFVELLGTGTAIRESNVGRGTADVLAFVAVCYFVVCFTLSRLGRWVEGRQSRAA